MPVGSVLEKVRLMLIRLELSSLRARRSGLTSRIDRRSMVKYTRYATKFNFVNGRPCFSCYP